MLLSILQDKEVYKNEADIPAEGKTEKERTRIPQENGYQKWKKCIKEKKSKR